MIVVKQIELAKLDGEMLETFLKKSPVSLLYITPSYLRLLEGFLSAEITLLFAYENEEVVGFLPLAFKHNAEHGTVCNSLPFYGSNGGITVLPGNANADEVCNKLFQEAKRIVEGKKCVSFTTISNPLDPVTDAWLRSNSKYDLLDERIGQITHLAPADSENIEDALLRSFEDPRPRNIRKAIKEGVTIRYDNSLEAREFLYKVHYDNITAINGIAKEKRFFDCIPDYFNDDQYRIYIAEHNGEKIGALLLFYFNETVEYFTPAVVEAYRNLQPTALLIYQAMIDAVRNGYKNWNWGGTWLSQGGVYDFKKKWGTTDYRYFYYTIIPDKAILNNKKEFFLTEYPYFFVAPFNALKLTYDK